MFWVKTPATSFYHANRQVETSMKTRLKHLLCLLFTLSIATSAIGQDAAFSQFYNTPFQTNPGMLSFRPEMMIGANFRSQWSGIGVPFTSFLVDGYYPILTKNKQTQMGAAGGFLLVDRQPAGKINTTSFGIAGSYKLPVNYANYFHCGLQLGYLRRTISSDGLTTGSQIRNGYYDPSLPNQEDLLGQSRGAPTIGLGTSWVNEDVDGDIRGQLGVAAYHLNAPNVSFFDSKIDNLKRNFVFTGSVRALKADQISIYPSARYIWQGPARKLNVGALARFPLASGNNRGPRAGAVQTPANFGFGLFYQTNDASAVIGTIEYAQSNYAISVNYNLGTSALKDDNKRGNAAEFFIAYRKTLGRKRKIDLRYFKTEKNSDGRSGVSDPLSVEPSPTPTTPVPTPAPTTTPAPDIKPAPPQQVAPSPSAPTTVTPPAQAPIKELGTGTVAKTRLKSSSEATGVKAKPAGSKSAKSTTKPVAKKAPAKKPAPKAKK